MRTRLILDGVALILYLACTNPTLTGISVHEWLGLGVLLVLLVHLIAGFDSVFRAFRAPRKGATIARALLDIALLIALTVCIVSGVMVSATVLPAFGLVAGGYFTYDPIHAVSAKILLALLLVHLFVNAGRVVRGLFPGRKSRKIER